MIKAEKSKVKSKDLTKITFRLFDEKSVLELSEPNSNSVKKEVEETKVLDRDHPLVNDKGLYSQTIFGPVSSYECKCIKHKPGKVKFPRCPVCNVEIGDTSLRKFNFGYVDLTVSIKHPFLKEKRIKFLPVISPDLRLMKYADSGYIKNELYDHLNIPENVKVLKSPKTFKEGKKSARLHEYGILIKKLLETKIEDDDKDFESLLTKLVKHFKRLNTPKGTTSPIFLNETYVITESQEIESNSGRRINKSTKTITKDVKKRLLINIGDINYLYRKIIDVNNKLKFIVDLQKKGVLFEIYKYCLKDLRKLFLEEITGEKEAETEEKLNLSNDGTAKMPIHNLVYSRYGIYRKTGSIKTFYPTLNSLIASDGDRMTDEEYDCFRITYNKFFNSAYSILFNKGLDRFKNKNLLNKLFRRYNDDYSEYVKNTDADKNVEYKSQSAARNKNRKQWQITGERKSLGEYLKSKYFLGNLNKNLIKLKNPQNFINDRKSCLTAPYIKQLFNEINTRKFYDTIFKIIYKESAEELEMFVRILLYSDKPPKNNKSYKKTSLNDKHRVEKGEVNEDIQNEDTIQDLAAEQTQDDNSAEANDSLVESLSSGLEYETTANTGEDNNDVEDRLMDDEFESEDEIEQSQNHFIDFKDAEVTGKDNIDDNGDEVNQYDQQEWNNSKETSIWIKDFKSRIEVQSLYSKIKGKEGLIHNTGLGKRVNFSGRSVITVNPNLKINECGIPFYMAIKLFEPHLLRELEILGKMTPEELNNHIISNEIKCKILETIQTKELITSKIIRNDYRDKQNPRRIHHLRLIRKLRYITKLLIEHKNRTNAEISIYETVYFGGHGTKYKMRKLNIADLFSGEYLDVIWSLMEKILVDKTLLLVRNPTLHRMNVQSFYPKLTIDKSINFHPLVLKQFGADIDGDQMAIFLPLSKESCKESEKLLLSGKYIFMPGNGEPAAMPSQDVLLGLYYLTKDAINNDENCRTYSNPLGIIIEYEQGKLNLHQNVYLLLRDPGYSQTDENKSVLIKTTAGRVLFNRIVPKCVDFVNETLNKREVEEIIKEVYSKTKDKTITNKFIEDLKELGLKYATLSGISIGIDTISESYFNSNLVESMERNKDLLMEYEHDHPEIFNIKQECDNLKNKIEEEVIQKLKNAENGLHPFHIMLDSGARGSRGQIMQMAGIKGYLNIEGEKRAEGESKKKKTKGKSEKGIRKLKDWERKIIEQKPEKKINKWQKIEFNPSCLVTSNFIKGLDYLDFIVNARMARMLKKNESENVSDSGYFNKKLVFFAEDIIIDQDNCGTDEGIEVEIDRNKPQHTYNRIFGKTLAKDTILDGNTAISKGLIIDYVQYKSIINSKLSSIYVKSPLKCKNAENCCAKCYGQDLATAKLVKLGTSVGILAAQSIGERSTQLILKNFHTGGITKGKKIEDTLIVIKSILENPNENLNLQSEINLSDEAVVFEQKNYLTNKIFETFTQSGVFINIKHIELIMKFLDIDEGSRGIKNIPVSTNQALKKISYENLAKQLTEVLDYDFFDDLSCVTSRKLCGKLINAGTGMTGDAYLEE